MAGKLPPLLSRAGFVLKHLQGVISIADTAGLQEEFERKVEMFDVPMTGIVHKVAPGGRGRDIPSFRGASPGGPIRFDAFIDGVQRTILFAEVFIEGKPLRVPVHLAHIAAGILFRNADRRLVMDPNFVKSRLVMLMPLEGMRRAGWKGAAIIDSLITSGALISDTKISEDPDEAFSLLAPDAEAPLIFADTTFEGFDPLVRRKQEEDYDQLSVLDQEGDSSRSAPLIGSALYNNGRVRGRAQGRVATIRQHLEMVLLRDLRQSTSDGLWVLVDGPLFFIGKRAGADDRLGSNRFEREASVLRQAVGLVKTLRLRPDESLLKRILEMKENEWSDVLHLGEVIGDEGVSLRDHLVWFTRLRVPPGQLRLPSTAGLVRVDVHSSTFDSQPLPITEHHRAVYLSDEQLELIPDITRAVWHERWPFTQYYGRELTQMFPVSETENVLHSRLYTRFELGSLLRALFD